ncbi:MAG: phosphoribulokinase [Chromatiales bacterium]
MSKAHPIIAVTGSSGAGTSSVKVASEHIFRRDGIRAAAVEGDSFHRYERSEMERLRALGEKVTHFGPEGNLFDELEALFRDYSAHGSGRRRHYIHTQEEGLRYDRPPGTFTEWEPLPRNTDLLFYDGLHGGLITDKVNVAQYVDLLIGVVPIINLEWIQKIHRDKAVRGYSAEAATQLILHRMHDYVHYIVPQFSLTDINFQRVSMVDTSNPFAAAEIPSNDESLVVIHIANRKKILPDFRYLLEMLSGSFMSRPDTIVVPGGKKSFAMEIIIGPVIERLLRESGRWAA